MTNKTTKRALLSSTVALFLCFAMLLGTTYAWFTDSVTSANNIIKSGNLDVEFEYATFNADGTFNKWETVADKKDILTNTLWEPGVAEVAYLRVANAGSLALKYQLGINILSETEGKNVAGEKFLLSDYIQFGVVEGIEVNATTKAPTKYATREDAVAAIGEGQKISAGYTKAASMASDEELYLALVVWMPTDVGNVANHDGTNVPEINLGLNIVATQMTAENDSFGKDYDDGAYIPVAPEAVPEAGGLELNSSAESNVTVKVPASVVAGLDDAVTSLQVAASKPVFNATAGTVTFTTVELQDQNGNKVDLSDATAKVTVILPVGDAFANGERVEVYHDGSFVTYATVVDGKISYEVSHFCEVEVKGAEEVVLDNTIDSVKEFIAFANAVNAGNSYAGQTVVLGADLDLAGVTWTPIGTSANPFKGTFDGNGKVIKNLSVLMAGKSNVGLFGFTTDGEIKNVTVENAKVAGRLNVGVVAGTPYTSKYTNITVKGHVEVDGMAYVGAVGGKNAYANWTDITVDVDATSYVNANSVENGVAYRTYVGGVVGFNGEGGHTFKDITTNINVYGSTCDIGGAFGIAHYENKFENVTVTGTVTCTDATTEIGGVIGVWHNENGTTVTLTDCKYEGESDVNVVGSAYIDNGTGKLIVDGEVVAASAATLQTLLDAAKDGATIELFCDITLTKTVTIAAGKDVVINLNGSTITGEFGGTGNQDMFLVKGNLTVKNGTIEMTATQNQGWNAMSTIFDITAGGVVTLDKVVADNKGGTDMNFVAHLNNWGTASLIVNDSTLKATYVAVRVFNSGYDMNTVVIKNSTLSTTGNAAFWVHNYTVADFGSQEKADSQKKLLGFTFENVTFEAKKAAFRYGMTNAEYYTADGATVVHTADELVAALAAGKNVVFANDITMKAETTNGYGVTGIVVNGQTVNGNGHTLKVTGASTTWDSAIYMMGGKIENLKITGAMRGVFMGTANADVYLENVSFGTIYTFNSDGGNKNYGVYISNSTMNGWTSHSNVHKEVVYTNCTFTEGSGYKTCRPYGPTEFVNCTFTEGFTVDKSQTTEIVFTDCTFQ